MKPLIGIISYLPPDEPRRSVRKARALRTVSKCNELFPGVPILVIAQGWKPMEAVPGAVFSFYSGRLGILGARKELRERFLSGGNDVLVMLDDDAELSGTREDGKAYLAEMEAHPGCFGERNGTALKLLSVPREILAACPYSEVDPEKGGGYEDRAFVGKLREAFPDRRFRYSKGPEANDNASTDPYSTWSGGKSHPEWL